MSIPTCWAIMRVVVPWNPYSPKIRRATVRMRAFIDSGSFRAFSRGVVIGGFQPAIQSFDGFITKPAFRVK